MGGRIKNLHRSGQERRDVWYKKKKMKKHINVLDSETGAADRKKSDFLEWEMFFYGATQDNNNWAAGDKIFPGTERLAAVRRCFSYSRIYCSIKCVAFNLVS